MTQPRDKEEVNNYGSDFVDVRDLASAVVASLQAETAAGQRFILDAGAYTFQNLCKFHRLAKDNRLKLAISVDDVLNEPPAMSGVPGGDHEAPKFSFPGAFCDSSKAVNTLGISFRPLKETARDALTSFRERGL